MRNTRLRTQKPPYCSTKHEHTNFVVESIKFILQLKQYHGYESRTNTNSRSALVARDSHRPRNLYTMRCEIKQKRPYTMNPKCSEALANTSVDSLYRWCLTLGEFTLHFNRWESQERRKKTFQSPLMLYMHPFTYTRRPSQMSLFANANEEFLISAFKLLINAEWTESIWANWTPKEKEKNPKLKIQNVQKSSNGENEINVIYFGYNSSPMCAAVRGNGDWCCCCRCCCRSKIKQLTLDLANAINSHVFSHSLTFAAGFCSNGRFASNKRYAHSQ